MTTVLFSILGRWLKSSKAGQKNDLPLKNLETILNGFHFQSIENLADNQNFLDDFRPLINKLLIKYKMRNFTYLATNLCCVRFQIVFQIQLWKFDGVLQICKILKHKWMHQRKLQGYRTRFETFHTNNFSWINDIVIKSQWFLGSWDREIWYKTFDFYFINLTWPPRPRKENI